MCCSGCLAVYNFILSSGLENYYKNRERPGNVITNILIKNDEQKIFNEEKIIKNYITKNDSIYSSVTLRIEGISCAACTWLIERHMKKNSNIKNFTINLATCKMTIIWNATRLPLPALLNEFQKIGYKAFPYNLKEQEKTREHEYKDGLKNLIISGLGMMQVMTLSFSIYMGEFNDINFQYWCFMRWVSFIITTPVLFISGKKFLTNALRDIKNNNLGMDVTVSLSLLLAYISSVKNLVYNNGHVYFDSICMFIFFLLIARFLEMRTRHHSGEIINSLQDLTSGAVRTILQNNVEKYVLIDKVKKDEIILIKSGEIIPLDGIVINGSSSVDESMLTGEFKPTYKITGQNVIGGTTNIENNLTIKVTSDIKNSKLNYIINLLEKINTAKPIDNLIINIISKYFVIIVLLLILITSIVWVNIKSENIMNIILSMLAITCPCALSLSVPIALTTSVNALSKIGFMITKENTLEKLSKSTDIIFDKTGTLTINKYFIKNIKLFRNVSPKKMLSSTSELEKKSNHPISKAFSNIKNKYLYNINNNTKLIRNYANKGLTGLFKKKVYKIGNIKYIQNFVKNKTLFLKKYQECLIIFAEKKGFIAFFNLTNPLRKNSDETIAKLKTLNLRIHLLTGDSSNNVNDIVKNLYIKNNMIGCSIQDKVDYITNIQFKNRFVIMIGDGINDVPALSQSNISIAMGSGTDLAKINADVILLNNNLLTVYKAIQQSKKTEKVIKQNILWSISYNFIGLFIAALNLITPYHAAIGMSISSLIVLLNSLRLGKI
jgi:Cu2+-exporting ATPase